MAHYWTSCATSSGCGEQSASSSSQGQATDACSLPTLIRSVPDVYQARKSAKVTPIAKPMAPDPEVVATPPPQAELQGPPPDVAPVPAPPPGLDGDGGMGYPRPPMPPAAPTTATPKMACQYPKCANWAAWQCPEVRCSDHCASADCPRHNSSHNAYLRSLYRWERAPRRRGGKAVSKVVQG